MAKTELTTYGHATSYGEWCRQLDVRHAHCPCGCEHPQPFIIPGTSPSLVCGKCWCQYGYRCEMIPCTPETCEDA